MNQKQSFRRTRQGFHVRLIGLQFRWPLECTLASFFSDGSDIDSRIENIGALVCQSNRGYGPIFTAACNCRSLFSTPRTAPLDDAWRCIFVDDGIADKRHCAASLRSRNARSCRVQASLATGIGHRCFSIHYSIEDTSMRELCCVVTTFAVGGGFAWRVALPLVKGARLMWLVREQRQR